MIKLPNIVMIKILSDLYLQLPLRTIRTVTFKKLAFVCKEWYYDFIPRFIKYPQNIHENYKRLLIDKKNRMNKNLMDIRFSYVLFNERDEVTKFFEEIGDKISSLSINNAEKYQQSLLPNLKTVHLQPVDQLDLQSISQSKGFTERFKELLHIVTLNFPLDISLIINPIKNIQELNIRGRGIATPILNLSSLVSLECLTKLYFESSFSQCDELIPFLETTKTLESLMIFIDDFDKITLLLNAISKIPSLRYLDLECKRRADPPPVPINTLIKMINNTKSLRNFIVGGFKISIDEKPIPVYNTSLVKFNLKSSEFVPRVPDNNQYLLWLWAVPSQISTLKCNVLNGSQLNIIRQHHTSLKKLYYSLLQESPDTFICDLLASPILTNCNFYFGSKNSPKSIEPVIHSVSISTSIKKLYIDSIEFRDNIYQLISETQSLTCIQIRNVLKSFDMSSTCKALITNQTLQEFYIYVIFAKDRESKDSYLQSLCNLIENNQNLQRIQIQAPRVNTLHDESDQYSQDAINQLHQTVHKHCEKLKLLKMGWQSNPDWVEFIQQKYLIETEY
ncbi:hypothetical protein DLAC_02343 [Tieghemostelium lacteum]|uniref:F-box domain-containing protein n=1 Tax=Tieghemostelium lacteum TaxID=361077 RepID=A0A152A586_TIELA|nr:hypothetical protein DLAC_02343 [Tieghemostelium lacteum]|eukprot:KYR01225.1 hypothetical protein DLAC_02343 [Tieghemostelium lacteum]